MRLRAFRMLTVLGMALAMAVATASAQQAGKKAHDFVGKVEKVDAKAKTMTVNGENVEGWMAAMTMNYKVENEDVLKKVKVGDKISAKVYDGDFMTLFQVQVVPPKDANPK